MQIRITRWPHNWVFFLACAAYLMLVIEPRLLYTCLGFLWPDAPAMPIHLAFADQPLSRPSGCLWAVTGLLSQGFYHAWSGALVIMAPALGLSELARRHFRLAGFSNLSALTCVPVILILLMYSRYKHPLLGVLVVNLGLLGAWVTARALCRSSKLGAILCCLTAVTTFWLGGTGALVIFAVTTLIHVLHRRAGVLALVIGLCSAVSVMWVLLHMTLTPVKEAWPLTMPLSEAVAGSMETSSRGIMVALYCFVPVCLGSFCLVRGAWRRSHTPPAPKSRKSKKADAEAKSSRRLLSIVKSTITVCLPFLLLGGGLFLNRTPLAKPYVKIHHHSHAQEWDRVLEIAGQLPKGQTSVYVHHAIVRALFHTNRLPFDLLRFPQTHEGLFLTHEPSVSDLTQLKLHDLFLELGQVNMAEKQVSELLASDVDLGCIYERLIWIHIIKGQYETARIFVNALHEDPLYRQTADRLARVVDQGPSEDQVKRIERIRACIPDHTDPVRESVDQMLIQLLNHNPNNKMAFEYLMTLYCLTGQLDKVTTLLPQTVRFKYPAIPAMYQEAAVLYFSSLKRDIDPQRLPIDPDTLRRYRRFVQLNTAFQRTKQKAQLGQLVREFGSSYFFYHSFRRVGIQ